LTERKQKIPMSDKDIASRLVNWGLCQRGRGGGSMSTRETRRMSRGGGGLVCMTAVVITLMRQAAHGPAGGATMQSNLDFHDAEVINRAWLRLGVRHKLLLRDLYALGRPVNVICRELSIKHWPASHWQRELLAAQDAIRGKLDSWNF
jgi:hypothetical protein